MNLLQRIFGRPVSAAWEVTPGDLIWKLQPAPGGILIGESRDVDQKRMSLFAIRTSHGEQLFSGIRLHDPWWVALEMTIGEVAILHGFPRPDLPGALGATAVDCASGEILWRDDGIRVLCGTEEIALVRRGDSPERNRLALIDVRTGALLEEIGEDLERAAAFQAACEGSSLWHGWISAAPPDGSDPAAGQISELLARQLKEPRGAAEFARYGRYTVVGAHARSRASASAMLGNLVDAHLLILRDERAVFHEIVTREAPAPEGDIFFIWNGMLIFIRERRTLVGINLNTA